MSVSLPSKIELIVPHLFLTEVRMAFYGWRSGVVILYQSPAAQNTSAGMLLSLEPRRLYGIVANPLRVLGVGGWCILAAPFLWRQYELRFEIRGRGVVRVGSPKLSSLLVPIRNVVLCPIMCGQLTGKFLQFFILVGHFGLYQARYEG